MAPFPAHGNGSHRVGRLGHGPLPSFSCGPDGGHRSFGSGWSLGIPAITRQSAKSVPRSRGVRPDLQQDNVFIPSNAVHLGWDHRSTEDGIVMHKTRIGGYRTRFGRCRRGRRCRLIGLARAASSLGSVSCRRNQSWLICEGCVRAHRDCHDVALQPPWKRFRPWPERQSEATSCTSRNTRQLMNVDDPRLISMSRSNLIVFTILREHD